MEGTHGELLRLGGHYEKLWRHQSGGFLADDIRLDETGDFAFERAASNVKQAVM